LLILLYHVMENWKNRRAANIGLTYRESGFIM